MSKLLVTAKEKLKLQTSEYVAFYNKQRHESRQQHLGFAVGSEQIEYRKPFSLMKTVWIQAVYT